MDVCGHPTRMHGLLPVLSPSDIRKLKVLKISCVEKLTNEPSTNGTTARLLLRYHSAKKAGLNFELEGVSYLAETGILLLVLLRDTTSRKPQNAHQGRSRESGHLFPCLVGYFRWWETCILQIQLVGTRSYALRNFCKLHTMACELTQNGNHCHGCRKIA